MYLIEMSAILLGKYMYVLCAFSAKPNTRTKRAFKFHEKGKFQQIAQKIRAKVGELTWNSVYIYCKFVKFPSLIVTI